jgi:hypothetical protein
MAKVCFRTLSLASAIVLAMAPAMAETRLDPPLVATAPPAESSQLQGVAALQFDAPAPSTAPSQPAGFGPMPSSPLLGAHPVQIGGGK